MTEMRKPEGASVSEWTMSDEREMLEKIVYHRFNFFMVLVTVIATSILRSESMSSLRLALGTGLGLSILFLFSLWKNQRRLNAALDYLMERPEHPVAILDKALGRDSSKGIIGYAIPLICIIFLLIANILVWFIPLERFR
jgi:Ca2+/Na+ antiporter